MNTGISLLKTLGIVSLLFNLGYTLQVPAFPGAEGYGAISVGGRGGRIIEVINLNNDGPGSFRQACAASGPRIVVFKVAGEIVIPGEDEIEIRNSNITIAGQTAPGEEVLPDPSIYIEMCLLEPGFMDPTSDNWELLEISYDGNGFDSGDRLPLAWRRNSMHQGNDCPYFFHQPTVASGCL